MRRSKSETKPSITTYHNTREEANQRPNQALLEQKTKQKY